MNIYRLSGLHKKTGKPFVALFLVEQNSDEIYNTYDLSGVEVFRCEEIGVPSGPFVLGSTHQLVTL